MPRLLLAMFVCMTLQVSAETIFLEAEDFTVESSGWTPAENRLASKLWTLHGATGDKDATARRQVDLPEGGTWRVWVRHSYWHRWRGTFQVEVLQDDKLLGSKIFDGEEREDGKRQEFIWDSFECELPAGPVELSLSKAPSESLSGYTRHVDCVLLTTDLELTPDHLNHGIQTYLRVTLGDAYSRPVYVHIFADHYRAPWYGHHTLSKAGFLDGLRPPPAARLKAGEKTPWCNITPMLYQDSGAILNFTMRHSYHEREEMLHATFEFATAPSDDAIVRTMQVAAQPNGLVVVCPPDLTTELHRSRLLRDQEFAEKTGKLADETPWPTIGKHPEHFPFFVAVGIGGYGTPVDQAVHDREMKTLGYFGFSNWTKSRLAGGTWQMQDGSYCRPDHEKIAARAAERAAEWAATGKPPSDVVYSMVMDEPTGQPLDFIAEDEAYIVAFRSWLEGLSLTPEELLVADWEAVRPVTLAQREAFPALYYFSQRFRTQALGDFIAVQRRALEAAVGGSFPVLVNFSDGATYHGNFYSQGVDYFELLNDGGQNAIWGEDWANGAASYQCGAYNVDLMRAAARERGQVIGHYLIAHAGRRPLDVKLKAAGNVARGTKILKSFSYGVYWGSHEGGPAWRSHCWQAKPAMWVPHAELVREIGGAEDLLLPAMPAPARVAILYSSATDAWQIDRNLAYGFDRMFTWMALAHGQIPVDILSEEQVVKGLLDGYDVCYLSGPNLTRAAGENLVEWVGQGGTLMATADAASRDEYDRPLRNISAILPAERAEATTPQSFRSSGRYLPTLNAQDTVTAGAAHFNVLSVRQAMLPREGATVLGTFADDTPAWVTGKSGQGTIHCLGFLPALDYMREALVARKALQDADPATLDEAGQARRAILERSANPWEYPAALREALLQPVRDAAVDPPVRCSVPLIDAVYMTCEEGIVIPLANYTLSPIYTLALSIQVSKPIARVESIHQGELPFSVEGERIECSLPLASTDYLKIYYR